MAEDEMTGGEGVAHEGASKPVGPETLGAPISGAPSLLAPDASKPPSGAPRTPTPAPASVESSPGEEPLKADIAKILKDIKLPERRSLPGAEPKEPTTIPISTVLGESMPEATTEPSAPTQQAKPVPPQNPTGVNAVHTLKHDLQGVVHDQKISYVRAVALEQEKKRPAEGVQTPAAAPRAQRTLGIVFAALLLLFLGGAALAGVYFVAKQNAAIPEDPSRESLVFAEQTVTFPIDGTQPSALKAQLREARLASNASLGSITRIVPVIGADETGAGRAAGLHDFLTAIGARAPVELLRALEDEFFFGIHTVDENAPVIVIPVISYDRAFASMLEWEHTLNEDLAPAFSPLPRLTAGEDGIPTQRRFADIVMRNYDVRALTDDAGIVQLYYSFPTRGVLIIAESPYSFTELLNRLQAGRKL
jgi:hypothetical protein